MAVNVGNAGKGRPKGKPNNVTRKVRSAISSMVSGNFTYKEIDRLIKKVEREDGAKAAFGCYVTLIEYVLPKLARIEHTGEDGGALTIEHMLKSLQSNPVQMRGSVEQVPHSKAREAAQPLIMHDQKGGTQGDTVPAAGKPLKLAMVEDKIDYDAIIDHDAID